MEEIATIPSGEKKGGDDEGRGESSLLERADSKTSDKNGLVNMPLLALGSVHQSFKASSFDDLDKQVKAYLEGKELTTITCWHDGKRHYCMLAATEAPAEKAEVLINGTPYRYRGQATVTGDHLMMTQCY